MKAQRKRKKEPRKRRPKILPKITKLKSNQNKRNLRKLKKKQSQAMTKRKKKHHQNKKQNLIQNLQFKKANKTLKRSKLALKK